MLRKILRNLSNLPGFRTSRKILVIESDDWGSIRMPSRDYYDKLKRKGLDLDSGDSKRYNLNDTLANAEDLSGLFSVLTKFKDQNNRHPVFTAVSLVANPDFEKISDSKFERYYFEPFLNTLKKYGRENAYKLWKEGIEQNIFIPQFHGREHLNVAAWMRALRRRDKDVLLAFEYGLWGYFNHHPHGLTYQAAFDVELKEDLEIQKKAITDGLKLFRSIHGYDASFFVPPNGPFNNSLLEVAAKTGIKYISGSKIQKEPLGEGRKRFVLHYLGQQNQYGHRYITRNCFFEPNLNGKDWINSCLSEINIAFSWKKPAVISTHRVNYIGALREDNRTKGLTQLEKLLDAVVKKWPEVEFMTTADLGEIINTNGD